MKIISEVKIRKFRSIKSITKSLKTTELNIFVGENDNGKSNILRALNLFFNGMTDYSQLFHFDTDYSFQADKGVGTRNEIRIDLIVNPPAERFKDAKPILWTKKWKPGSVAPVESRKVLKTGEDLPRSNNVSKWMDKLEYYYVPAIKGQEYFNKLMADLYDKLNESNGVLLSQQSQKFVGGLQKITSKISEELVRQIKINNTLQVPSDFKVLFSRLDFGEMIDENVYHLKHRGDGIKIRHIPVILKFMADQDRKNTGYIKPDIIWGFEEPENNLEMRFSFELAELMKKYSSDIQIFLTTHSPAFYSIPVGEKVSKFLVSKDGLRCTYVTPITGNDYMDIHDRMGLLPLISPFIKEANDFRIEIESSRIRLNQLGDGVEKLVLTEDEDTSYLKAILEANGFNLQRTEIHSFKGVDRVDSAKFLASYVKKQRPKLKVYIYIDRDYMSDDEVRTKLDSISQFGIPILSEGTDIESYFLEPNHLRHLNPELDIAVIKEVIDDATSLARKFSIGKMYNHRFSKLKGSVDYAKEIDRVESDYDSAPERYRSGKKVMALVKARLQRLLKSNPKVVMPSQFLKIEEI